jgi:imidazole glycerol phosphate synthase glutamine amidotransferase subunit
MKSICILDYGMGNVESLKNAIVKIGYEVKFFSDSESIESDFLIIPGVGAFNSAMNIFIKKKIDTKIKKFLEKKNSFLLGICLGKQLLYSFGNENKKTNGLNIIRGEVKLLSEKTNDKLPNVGWKEITISKSISEKFFFLEKFNNEKFYFVHSYVGIPEKKRDVIGTSEFKGLKFCSIVSNNKNIIGTQFHPEKSSKIGLAFLKTIIEKFI